MQLDTSPMKSASASGPMGCAIPSLKTSSTASGVATPSMTANMASFSSGMSTRLETNPGASLTSTGVFSSLSESSRTDWKVSSEVARPRTTSTSFITGTGLKKCIPITCCGRDVVEASLVMEIEDVFEARITSGRQMRSSSRNNSDLIPSFSEAASTMKSQLASLERSVVGAIRLSVSSFCASVIFALATSRSRFLAITVSARSSNFCSRSHSVTSYPLRANTCAIPLPMVPAPMTPTR